jgi:hypothetical protein
MKTFYLLSVLLLGGMLSGCGDIAHWQTRTFYGIDCRPEKLHNGSCVPTTPKGAADAQVSRP